MSKKREPLHTSFDVKAQVFVVTRGKNVAQGYPLSAALRSLARVEAVQTFLESRGPDVLHTYWLATKASARLAGVIMHPDETVLAQTDGGLTIIVTASQMDEHFDAFVEMTNDLRRCVELLSRCVDDKHESDEKLVDDINEHLKKLGSEKS